MRPLYLVVRSVLDRLIAMVALIVLSPLLLAVAVLVRLKMGSPVFFTQERVGIHGEPFRIIKFRTMIRNAEALGGGYMPSDLRLVPPFGEWLRKTSLDELPQLVNIVRGDISFVGPRPALMDHYSRYTPEQRRRVTVPQGLTGLAQVRYRNDAPWSVRIQCDLEYIERLGPRLDATIVFATIGKALRATGVRADQTPADVDDLAPAPTMQENES